MFRTYGVASAFVLLSFLLINYFMPLTTSTNEKPNNLNPTDPPQMGDWTNSPKSLNVTSTYS